MSFTRKDFQSGQEPRWCPGCGDYAVLAAVQKILAEAETPPHEIVFVSGIGCSSRFPYYVSTYGFHSIHGRATAVATGVKLANPRLQVWVVTGDGDGLSIGAGHLVHALRRNIDLKIILFNNRVYGLTKGQASPTAELGKKTKSSPWGVIDRPFNPLAVALGAEATFVARSLDADQAHLAATLRRARDHRGAAFVEVLQNCVVFNDGAFAAVADKTSRPEHALAVEHGRPLLFGRGGERGVRLSADGAELVAAAEAGLHDEAAPSPARAFALAQLEDPVPMGVLRAVRRPTLDENLAAQVTRAVAERGPGDLAALLRGKETWEVK